MTGKTKFFWQTKKLAEMTAEEWESLCDGCGKCCLHKLEDEDTGEIAYTRIACKLLDLSTCRCRKYSERTRLVSSCINLRTCDESSYQWLPKTCAYRLLHEGEELPVWHPLVTGDKESPKKAGISISSHAVLETEIDDTADYEDYILEWLD